MQNFQVIVLSVWKPTDKISHLHDCTFNGEIKKHFENLKISFLFHCHLLRQHYWFLKPKAFRLCIDVIPAFLAFLSFLLQIYFPECCSKHIVWTFDSFWRGFLWFRDYHMINLSFSFLRIWSHLLKKSLMENFIFGAVHYQSYLSSDHFHILRFYYYLLMT